MARVNRLFMLLLILGGSLIAGVLSSPIRSIASNNTPARSMLGFGEYNPGRLSQFTTPVSEGVREAIQAALNATSTHGFSEKLAGGVVNYASAQEGSSATSLQHVFTRDSSAMPQNEQAVGTNGSLVVVASNDYRNYLTFINKCFFHRDCNGTWIGTGIDVSRDGGNTISSDQLGPADPKAAGEINGDPGVAIYKGTIYVSSLDFGIFSYCSSGIVLWKSTNLGVNFTILTPPVTNPSCSSFTDKPAITVDASNSSYAGSLYVSWTHFGYNESDIEVASSHDGGQTWITRVVSGAFTNGTFTQFSYPAVAPDGSIYVTYADYSQELNTALKCFHNQTCPTGNGPVNLMLTKSNNGGNSWSPPSLVISIANPLPWPFWFMADHTFRIATQPKIAIDSSSSFTRGNIYIAWEDLSTGSSTDIFQCIKQRYTIGIVACTPASRGSAVWIARSSTGGQTFDGPQQLSGGGTYDSFMPWVTVDNSNGNIIVAYYTSRPDPYNARIYIGVSGSTTGGFTFTSHILPQFYEPSDDLLTSGFFWGDYLGVAASGGRAIVGYTGDGRLVNGYRQEDPYVAALPDNPISIDSPLISLPPFTLVITGVGLAATSWLIRRRRYGVGSRFQRVACSAA